MFVRVLNWNNQDEWVMILEIESIERCPQNAEWDSRQIATNSKITLKSGRVIRAKEEPQTILGKINPGGR